MVDRSISFADRWRVDDGIVEVGVRLTNRLFNR
jgi:hypothetical protein